MIYEYFWVTGAHEEFLITLIYFELLYKATMFKILMRDATKSCYQSVRYPSLIFLESVCKMRTRESDQLKTVLAMYEQEIEQHLSQLNCQKFKTMVKKCMDQKIRARTFEAITERIVTGVLVKTRKVKHVRAQRK